MPTLGASPLNPDVISVNPASGSAVTVPSTTTMSVLDVTLTAASVAFTFPTLVQGASFTMIVRQDATGSRTATFPGTVQWAGNVAPTLTTTATKFDMLVFACVDGTHWIGSVAGQNYG